jgi:hypothetical protein
MVICVKSFYSYSFSYNVYKAFENDQITNNEKIGLIKLYMSGKKIEATSQLKGYCKRKYKV